jgi:hydrogenase maturation protease
VNVVVVGVGNAYRGDDAVGLTVAEVLRERAELDVRVRVCEQEPTRLIDAWEGADVAFVVDAVASGAEVGRVHRFDAATPLPARVFGSASTHALGVADAVELARTLGRLPERTIVYGIEGASFGAGADVTPEVAAAATQVAQTILEEVAACTSRP